MVTDRNKKQLARISHLKINFGMILTTKLILVSKGYVESPQKLSSEHKLHSAIQMFQKSRRTLSENFTQLCSEWAACNIRQVSLFLYNTHYTTQK